MLRRCRNTADKNYGGRGIKVCKRWESFLDFLKDVGEGKRGWSLERINNHGDYELSNICWATGIKQARNTRANVVFTVCGITDCVAGLCEHFKMPAPTVYHRLHRGWPIYEALFVPYKFRLINQRST